ncbi:hypothetical protein HPB48_015746 [Haemaphysalis longicornis]|uniref:Palmitoyltransferase n=1 Tax=Haemaphysalis longicornis TaxID=44386 RepID=A0A9J6GVD1_HAELO|nr:hypothetical protein HPB48_015746 [Haemaphysalis longicornis]
MDHHCPWFNNCVSFSTHKSFLLTLAYGSVLAAFTALTALIPAASAWLSLGLSFTALNVSCVVAGGAYLSIAVAAFMCVQLGYLYRNVTTLENMRPTLFREQTDSFDLGRKKKRSSGLYRTFVSCSFFTTCVLCRITFNRNFSKLAYLYICQE